ncbi:hypothetical protein RB195_015898 [Necator americanus]|uniref:VWFA domain-containing protein n=1 Tax=Necator americanus TaxID=51031 RepID=A0ABR1E6S8_NECAM
MSDVSNSISAWETLPEEEPPLCIAARRPVSPPRHYEAVNRCGVVDELDESCKALGLQCKTGRDKNDNLRPFAYLPVMYAVRGSKFNPEIRDLHDACSMFFNGYLASLSDFKDKHECEKTIGKMSSSMVRATVRRDASNLLEAKKCQREEMFKAQRRTWYSVDNKGAEGVLNEIDWRVEYPSNFCADLPRTTAGIYKCGYVDIPTFARRPLVCTYGNPPNVPVRNRTDICNPAAYFDTVQGQCRCKNPKLDGKVRDPQKYADYPWGTVCFECITVKESRSIVFILDGSGTVRPEGWKEQKLFMLKVVDHLKNVRVGIVVVLDESEIALGMSDYETVRDKFREYVFTSDYPYSWTSIGYALYLARTMLEKEKTMHKTIIIFNDGDFDKCWGMKCIFTGKILIKINYPQKKEAELPRAWRRLTSVELPQPSLVAGVRVLVYRFASMGAQVDIPRGRGPYCYRIHGQIYHRIGCLHPNAGEGREYGQLHILDTEMAAQQRPGIAQNSSRDADLMRFLSEFLEDLITGLL